MLMEIVSMYPAPIYVNHEIIHNTWVVRMFERKGVIFEPALEKIPKWSLVVISAHGTGPSYFAELRTHGLRWIDATCPLVEKVHREARDAIAKGYHILYIGKRWHQEALGVMDEGSENFTLIENIEDVEKIQDTRCKIQNDDTKKSWINNLESIIQYTILTQTTLSVDDTASITAAIQERIPDVILPKAWDICYATTNRQRAVKVLAEETDVILVVGSANSSNSSKLQHVAESLGKTAYLIDSADDIDQYWFDNCSSVGVTAWASGPEELVEWVVEYLVNLGWVFDSELRVVEEKIEFPYTLTIQS
jgi:4-hydroxy-3-methylbut-2-en-1-yl diphosphate reductase